MHLSRICEELIIWSTSQFNYVSLPEELCTGSSIMPQKKNPDMAELIRGGTAMTLGNLFTLLGLIKNQPLAYNRDNQEDKKPLFQTIDFSLSALQLMSEMIAGSEFNRDQMLTDVYDSNITATDIAEYLVKKGVPFRKAHDVTGKIVKFAEDRDLLLLEISLDQFQKLSNYIEEDIYEYLDPLNSVDSKDSIGGTSFKRIRAVIKKAKSFLA